MHENIDISSLDKMKESKRILDLQIYNEISRVLQPILKNIELLRLNIKSMQIQQIEQHLTNMSLGSQKLNNLINDLIKIANLKSKI